MFHKGFHLFCHKELCKRINKIVVQLRNFCIKYKLIFVIKMNNIILYNYVKKLQPNKKYKSDRPICVEEYFTQVRQFSATFLQENRKQSNNGPYVHLHYVLPAVCPCPLNPFTTRDGANVAVHTLLLIILSPSFDCLVAVVFIALSLD